MLNKNGLYKGIVRNTIVFQDAMLFAAPGTKLKGFINAYSHKHEVLLRFSHEVLDINSRYQKLNTAAIISKDFTLSKLEANSEAERERKFASVTQKCT